MPIVTKKVASRQPPKKPNQKPALKKPGTPARKPTIKKPAPPPRKPVRRPPVAKPQKAPTVTPLPPPVHTHASPQPPQVVHAAQQQAAAPVAPAAPTLTPAQQMWEEIKNLPINMFGLPSQTVQMHATPVAIEPSRLYLTIRSSATLPSLEESVKGKFNVEMVDKFVVVTRVPAPLVPHK